MKETVSFHRFRDVFMEVRPNNFSYEGLEALYNYLLDFEAETGEEMELDIIALCCDFTKFSSIEDFNNDCGRDYESMYDISYSNRW